VDQATEAEEVDERAIGRGAHDFTEGDGADSGKWALSSGGRRWIDARASRLEAVRAPSAELEARAAQRLLVGDVAGAERRQRRVTGLIGVVDRTHAVGSCSVFLMLRRSR
jgi:hypothetical protein